MRCNCVYAALVLMVSSFTLHSVHRGLEMTLILPLSYLRSISQKFTMLPMHNWYDIHA